MVRFNVTTTRTDNSRLAAKLDLRRHFLRRYHPEPADRKVLDCCQGNGLIWLALRKEFPVESYWGLDVKRRRGRLAIDSVRVLQQPGLQQNIIDIDTYGSPWRHWFALLPNVRHPSTVFLTAGRTNIPGTSRDECHALGLDALPVPITLLSRVRDLMQRGCLAAAAQHGLRIVEGMGVQGSEATRYLGLRIEPAEPQDHARESQPHCKSPQEAF